MLTSPQKTTGESLPGRLLHLRQTQHRSSDVYGSMCDCEMEAAGLALIFHEA